ncbi:MAG TPA: amino acid ABC transporter permease [Caldimonas sp.]|jgi:polar amino acid transport system permease protein|nr:amino acid ABC transporter permease [Caldimonas sp.]
MDLLLQSLPYLMKGAVQTLWMALAAIVLGTLMGIGLGFAAVSRFLVVRVLIDAYVFVLRGIPVLVLMFITYYAFPAVGYRISNYAAVTVALTLYAAAFYTDIVRGSLRSLPKGQTEAAKSLGMSRSWIVLDILAPQALKHSIAPWLNTSIVTLKSTSYASIVGAWELTYASKEIVERTLATFEIFGAVMVFYFILCYPMSLAARRFEKQIATH